jgi:hypothetical protein
MMRSFRAGVSYDPGTLPDSQVDARKECAIDDPGLAKTPNPACRNEESADLRPSGTIQEIPGWLRPRCTIPGTPTNLVIFRRMFRQARTNSASFEESPQEFMAGTTRKRRRDCSRRRSG